MLFDEFMEPCVRTVAYRESDGQGGSRTKESDSEPFMAAIVLNASNEGTVAASERMQRTYTVTCPIGTNLGFYERIKRLSDGRVFLITSSPSDVITPNRASFSFEQVQAEAVEA